MENLEQILRSHAARYPKMQPTDAVKLIYQNVFGGGHLIRDPAACLSALRREYEAVPRDPSTTLLEDIGNGMVRVMLAAIDGSGYSAQRLGHDFINSSGVHKGSLPEFLEKLEILRAVTESGAFRFSPETLDAYLTDYKEAGYPMVSHSPEYREAYRPAYRIVLRSILPEDIGEKHVF